MSRNSDEGKLIALGFAVLMAIATAILISRFLFPIFAIGTVIFLIVLIFLFISEMRAGYGDYGDYSVMYARITLFVCLVGTGFTYGIGYGLGNSSIGQVSLEVHDAVTGVQEQLDNSINQAVDEGCKTMPQESCQLLRGSISTYRTVQDITDMAEKLKKAADVAQAVSR